MSASPQPLCVSLTCGCRVGGISYLPFSTCSLLSPVNGSRPKHSTNSSTPSACSTEASTTGKAARLSQCWHNSKKNRLHHQCSCCTHGDWPADASDLQGAERLVTSAAAVGPRGVRCCVHLTHCQPCHSPRCPPWCQSAAAGTGPTSEHTSNKQQSAAARVSAGRQVSAATARAQPSVQVGHQVTCSHQV